MGQTTGGGADTDELARRLQAALGADYVVEQPLGEGGFAIVYAATDRKLSRRIAVKVLRPELTVSPGAKQRFIREAESAARLNHPHILPIFFVGEGEGVVYFGMPLVEGETLEARLRRSGQLPEPEAARIGAEIADALAEAHAAGLVHRDIKPSNVMLQGTRGRVLVTDFGIAKAAAISGEADKLTRTGVVIGSPHYMSPEQAGGTGAVDHRSDLYSLGIVLWQMLAGAVPFDSAESQAVLMKQVTQDVPPIRSRRADVSPAMAAVVARCTAKKADDRFASAELLSAALRALAAAQFAPRPNRRAFAATVLALLAVTALAAAFLLGYPRRPAAAGGGERAAALAQAQSAAPMIAVLPFTVVTAQDTQQFARSLAGLFAEALAQRNGVSTVDANNLLGLWNADRRRTGAPLDSSARFAYGMGANQMILGSYVESGRQFRLTISMYDTHDLSRLWRDEATGPTDSLFSLVDRLANRAATALCGQPEYNPAQLCFDVAARPSDSLSVTVAESPADSGGVGGGGVGTVSFYARVTPEGQLADVRFRTGAADEDVAGRALAALRGARFTPARKGGRAVEAWTSVDVPVLVTGSAAATAAGGGGEPAADPRCADPAFGARNENRACFDQRPVAVANLPVVRTPVACASPPTPATVLLRVNDTGEVTSTPELKARSSCAAFDSAATVAAAQIVFSPATRDGRPVEAWTQVRVVPAPPGAALPVARRLS